MTTISKSILQFTVCGGAADDDGLDGSSSTVHPHDYNGYLAIVAHNNTKPAMKAFVEENIDIVSLFPIVAARVVVASSPHPRRVFAALSSQRHRVVAAP